VNEAPAPLSRLRPEVAPRLESVVERALAKAPEERYGSALELASDIADALEVHVPAAETLARDRVEALRGLGFFRGFREADLWELLRWSDWREHRAGDAIRAEGEDERALQIVVEGEVERFREGRALATLGRGECFGEVGYLDGTVAGESVIARCPSAILEVRADAVERATASCRAQFQKALIGVLIRRLRESRPPPMVPEAEGEPLQ
jgi:CRP-like cAMP-binding protein